MNTCRETVREQIDIMCKDVDCLISERLQLEGEDLNELQQIQLKARNLVAKFGSAGLLDDGPNPGQKNLNGETNFKSSIIFTAIN